MFGEVVDKLENEFGENKEAEEFATLFGFINLSIADIIILFNYYWLAKNDYEKNLICRTASHHMYEFSIDGGKIFGSQLKKYANILNVLEVEDEIDELRKLFNIIKKEISIF